MPKNPTEFRNIKESFDDWTLDIIRTLPNRKNKTYKNSIKKFFITYLDFKGKFTRKSLGELSSKISKKSKKIKEFIFTHNLDYIDIKKEYYKIKYTKNEYLEQRTKNILGVCDSVSVTHKKITYEKSNISHYRNKMFLNMNDSELSLKSQLIFVYHELCKYESTLKLLKILSKEVDYLLSFF